VWADFPLCPLAGTFGVPCPGCGLTRATLALLRGDVRTALRLHPLVWLMGPVFVGFLSAAVLELRRGEAPARRPRLAFSQKSITAVALLLAVASFGVWLSRFAGYFGGPVPVTTMSQWLAARRR
jgi:Protein of unknown function (DUF2752)